MIKFKKPQILCLAATILSLTLLLNGCQAGDPAAQSQYQSSAPAVVVSESETVSQPESSTVTSAESAVSSAQTSSAPSSKASVSSASSSKTESRKSSSSQSTSSAVKTQTDKLSINVLDSSNAKGKMAVWFFSMPSDAEHTGDCTLIRTPSGKTMLIDTGNSAGGQMVIAYLDQLGIKKLDVLVITHMHQDHVGGAVKILKHLPVDKVYGTPLKDYQTSSSRGFLTELTKKSLTYTVLKQGDIIQLDSGIALETLWPRSDFSIPDGVTPEKDGGFTNNSSVVLRMKYGQKTFLFTGDIEMEVEDELVAQMPQKLQCDVVKIPHHGASTSSSLKFIQSLKAKYGVIMVYALNDINVINRYKSQNVNVQITSVNGTVLFLTDGNTIQYASSK